MSVTVAALPHIQEVDYFEQVTIDFGVRSLSDHKSSASKRRASM
ncbi:hypothetical protein SPB21_05190 [Leptothoe sp. ISB3NOV94-8A]